MKYCLFAMCFLLGGARLRAQSRRDPQIAVISPLKPLVQRGGVVPVVVRLRTGKGFAGEVRVRCDLPGSPLLRRRIDVGRGEFRLELPYVVPLHAGRMLKLRVSLEDAAGTTLSTMPVLAETVAPADFTNTFVVGWLADRGVPDEVKKNGRPVDSDALYLSGRQLSQREHRIVSHQLRVRQLYETWQMYWGYDLIAVTGRIGDDMEARHVRALDDWVRCGGRLLLGRDSAGPETRGTPFDRAFGAIIRLPGAGWRRQRRGLGEVVVADLDLSSFASSAYRNRPKPKEAEPATLKVIINPVREETPGKPADEPAADRFKDVVERAVGLQLARKQHPAETMPDYYSYDPEQAGVSDVWADSLERWINLPSLKRNAILGLTLVFVIIVGVGERLLLKRLRRLHWTWVTTPLLIVVFCAGAYYLQRLSRGYRSHHAWVGIHDYAPEGGGIHRSMHAFIPASGGRYELTATGSQALLTRCVYEADRTDAVVASSSRGAPQMAFSGPVWSPVFTGTMARHTEPPPLVAKLRLENGRLTGTVTAKDAALEVLGAEVLWRGRYWQGRARVVDGKYRLTLDGHDRAHPTQIPRQLSGPEFQLAETQHQAYYWGENSPFASCLDQLGMEAVAPAVCRLGGICQVPWPSATDTAVVLVVARQGPGPELNTAFVVDRQIHIYRQFLRLQGTP